MSLPKPDGDAATDVSPRQRGILSGFRNNGPKREKRSAPLKNEMAYPQDGTPGGDPDKAAPWAKSLIRAVAFADARAARVIGITGIRRGTGASEIAREFAKVYSLFTKRILFVNTPGAELVEDERAARYDPPDLSAQSRAITTHLNDVDLSQLGMIYPVAVNFFADCFEAALRDFDAIVVNLPSVDANMAKPQQAFLSIAPACRSVLIVCETGRTTQNELRQSLASCKINGTPLDGILLNDAHLPQSWLLSDE